jgi:hypothetical protein
MSKKIEQHKKTVKPSIDDVDKYVGEPAREAAEDTKGKPLPSIRPIRILLEGLTLGNEVLKAGQIVVRPSDELLAFAENDFYGKRWAEHITRSEAAVEIERMLEDAKL